ncbi:MAG: hypothetical protein KAG53_05395, partial [Endozoicomonadaceae bacterium]|nr:hypothetical protein [Endozoicomonadaceae bacterium]
MEYSTACNDCIGRAFDILFNGQNMKDEDLVYLDDLSIKVIDLDASPIESQHSLKKLLYEKLSSAGRKSLAKRSIEERSITYKDLKLVSHYINNPRTKQTLLDRGYQQLSSNYNSLPDLVKKDMGKHEILRFPDNIHILHLMMTCHNLKRDSLALKKHLTTKCMDIDANSRYEDLEEEHEECSEMIFSVSPIVEKLNDHIAYAATLYDLYGIWKLEDSDKWNRCILDPTILSHVHPSLIEHSSNTLHKDELQDVNIDSLFKKEDTVSQEAIECSANLPSTIFSELDILDLGQYSLIAEKATESSPLMSDDETTNNDISLQLQPESILESKDKVANKEAIECSANLPSTIFSELDILDLGQYSLIAEKATESSPLMSDAETTNNDISLQLQPESILESKDKVANKEAIECSANLPSTIFSELDILDLGQYSLIAE